VFIVVIPKPGEEGAQIRDSIFKEITDLATSGPSEEEMEKLRNNLFNGSVRSRQSSLYRSQQLAEFALYDRDPELFNTDLQNYLDVTAAQIRDAVAKYLDNDNRVLLEIVPGAQEAAPASPQPPGEPAQPAAPPAQIPPARPEPAPTGPIAAPDEAATT
jgi:zinc protease